MARHQLSKSRCIKAKKFTRSRSDTIDLFKASLKPLRSAVKELINNRDQGCEIPKASSWHPEKTIRLDYGKRPPMSSELFRFDEPESQTSYREVNCPQVIPVVRLSNDVCPPKLVPTTKGRQSAAARGSLCFLSHLPITCLNISAKKKEMLVFPTFESFPPVDGLLLDSSRPVFSAKPVRARTVRPHNCL